MKQLKNFINESKGLNIKNNPKLNTFDICNLTGDEYNLICKALKELKFAEGTDLLKKIYDAEEPVDL